MSFSKHRPENGRKRRLRTSKDVNQGKSYFNQPRRFEVLEKRCMLSATPFFSIDQEIILTGSAEDSINIPHTNSLELESGTFALSFSVDDSESFQTLFSKDHSGYQDGGHLTAWTSEGRVKGSLAE